jgi:predicted lipid-binding transport protein (Tim44 family)
MLGGLLMGGLIGSLLFGGFGRGFFGGIGLMEILIVGGLVVLALRLLKNRQPGAVTPGYATAGGYGGQSWQPESTSSMSVDIPVAPTDLDRGVAHIRQLDSAFDPVGFADDATDMFFKIQAAWTARDVNRVADLLTPEMESVLRKDCDRLRAEGRINRLENVAVRQASVSEAWQERGQDFATVYFLASLVDYTTDESGSRVLDGSRDQPVKFEEYWTFVRPVGNNHWKLSAIQQAS